VNDISLVWCRGGPLERGLACTIPDVLLGSLLVQSDSKTGEPLLLHVMLPLCIRDRKEAHETWVFLLDAQVMHKVPPSVNEPG
jgi:uridine kinase